MSELAKASLALGENFYSGKPYIAFTHHEKRKKKSFCGLAIEFLWLR
jgi:hypothetical protein